MIGGRGLAHVVDFITQHRRAVYAKLFLNDSDLGPNGVAECLVPSGSFISKSVICFNPLD